jgi:hypothetical protein
MPFGSRFTGSAWVYGRSGPAEERRELPFVIADSQIFSGRHELPLVTSNVDVPLTPSTHRTPQREHSPFPGLVKHGLVRFRLDRTHPLHVAHIMHAVHAAIPFCGAVTLATPTMASRVTSAASCSSRNSPVPAGRSGKTR